MPLAPGARLELELDLLDAVEEIQGAEGAETRWCDALDWVDTRAGAAERGLAWQRRGVCLARRGDMRAAETAFRKAMAQWAQSSAGGEQVADAFYSLHAAIALNGDFPGDPQDRVLAAELRVPGESQAARAEMLMQWGMRARIRSKLPLRPFPPQPRPPPHLHHGRPTPPHNGHHADTGRGLSQVMTARCRGE